MKVYLLIQEGEVLDVFSTYEKANSAKYSGDYYGHWDSFEIEEKDVL